MGFSFSYSPLYLLLCIFAGLVYAWLLYRKQKSLYPASYWVYVLAGLRFLSGFIIGFLLLSPILKYRNNQTEKPTLVFLQDQSSSLKAAFKKTDSIQYRKSMTALLDNLGKDYDIKQYSFGKQIRDSVQYTWTEQGTDLSGTLETIWSTLENKNLGAIIMASDGIYNQGVSPLSLNYPFKGAMFTIGLGDTSIRKDAMVARVFANKLVYLGDQFALRSDIAAFAAGGSKINVSIFHHNARRTVSNQSFTAESNRFARSVEVVLSANSVGVQHFTIEVSKLDGEQNIVNNKQDVYVEVIDSKENILVLGQAPHPDLFALKEALSRNKNYKVQVNTADQWKGNLNEFNLLVLHNLPSGNFPISALLEQARKGNISVWYILGSQTNLAAFNAAQKALQLSSRGLSSNDAQAILNPDFSYFVVEAGRNLLSLPPLASPLGDYKPQPGVQTLFYQKLGGVNTQFPLWMMGQDAGTKTGVLAGEGLWRWRMYAYSQYGNHSLVDDYVLKTAQFLSVKQDRKPLRVNLPKTVFTETEPVVIDAALYNENYEQVNSTDINLKILDSAGQRMDLTMNKQGLGYAQNLGTLAPGTYSYQARTNWHGKNYSETGQFVVVAEQIEDVNTTADFGLLNQLAKQYDGKFVLPAQINSLEELIRNHPAIKSVIRSEIRQEPLINWKWLFGILLLLLAAEWFMRKRLGQY